MGLKLMIAAATRRKAFQPLWERLHRFSTIAMNFWASDMNTTGEVAVMHYVASKLGHPATIFDVGGNVGLFSTAVLDIFPSIERVEAFEPSKSTAAMFVQRLASHDRHHLVHLHNLGIGAEEAVLTLYSGGPGATTASLYKLDQHELARPHDDRCNEQVQIATIDDFCAKNGIESIDFLKLDIEGHELFALQGTRRMLADRRIRFIQFEFGAFHIDSRTFFRDFHQMLAPTHRLYRIVPDGLVELGAYTPNMERFATMNYLAERR